MKGSIPPFFPMKISPSKIKIQGYEAETCPNSSTLTLATSTDLHFMSSLSLESCHLARRVWCVLRLRKNPTCLLYSIFLGFAYICLV